ncbi:hypothetical protein LUW74_29955 [Actinomadura madurae]|uniref:hypothetical protein n=1 Tax=Actinomadura madurae TaxID=1993 RepID=UPI002026C6B8|nr:hypothetical protein [Actinomadura madurae]URN07136.1 hypothetical protein LUW74_29955 [Actinomadura madurae]
MTTGERSQPYEDFGIVVCKLRQSTGLTMKQVATRARAEGVAYAVQTWSAWQTGRNRIKPDALAFLIGLAGSAEAELIEEAQDLLGEAADAQQVSAAEPADRSAKKTPPISETAPQQASSKLPQTPDRDKEPTPTTARRCRRRGHVVAGVSLLAAITLLAAVIWAGNTSESPGGGNSRPQAINTPRPGPITTSSSPSAFPKQPTGASNSPPKSSSGPRQPPTTARRNPPPVSTLTPATGAPAPACERNHYKVDEAGDLINEQGDRIGRAIPGDIFIRDMSNTRLTKPYRYYGTIKGSTTAGYFMQRKISATCG